MKLFLEKSRFLRFLENTTKIIESNNSNYELRGAYFQVRQDKIILISSNEDISIKNEYLLDGIKNKTEGESDFLVLNSLLKNIIKKCSDSIILEKEKNTLKIFSDLQSYEINLLDHERFPDIKFGLNNSQLQLKTEQFKQALKNVVFAADLSNAQELLLNSVNLSLKNNILTLVATNRARIAMQKIKTEDSQEFNLTINSKVVKELISLSMSNTLILSPGTFELKIKSGNLEIKTKVIEIPYMNVENVFPNKFNFVIHIDKKELLSLIDKVSIVNDEKNGNKILIEYNPSKKEKKLKLSSYWPDLGFSEVFSDNFEVESEILLKFFINANYLKESINVFDGMISIFITENKDRMVISSETNLNNKQLIAALRGH
ncbi:DNA POLYMERASE III, BETA CHAIN [Mycoplasmopsis pulmonis]|uniref:Beta sliding clamp n=1 Tax=Mycoplasmopsis pulmonis (strain UAB CTIP) TaxID=272635 RepID=DPO3B_MYCPU|nr:DNA polymerase III subunit beta [Mycoplasmopsis pulmonis]Q98RK6.1 RecName: Full=Beta sliding clamp; Short=Beta clamp; Short=Sliding clamp; AltName: Full=Beta-clamp processivity factor; AltName: Full=DNA polymerase III beta sliding clamp subunit; AltName: Full=DNA polymerase III subunit beta [Mycoplasmopsis pulmonis UAB CTIP]MDZ7293374.1 DNA polymerase III subunit beta [Mycoplasmopsis pulmonis]CAC13175.1 DNA POLYMERASE III, BETA CHAIN [Mycoplasmopsis pulmonis]VEU67795.1 DNA polymerase III bet